MKLRIIAKNNNETFLGYCEEFDYVVISLMGPDPIDLDDVLSSKTWDGHEEDYEKEVKNITQDDTADIMIESWGCSKESGYEFLFTLGDPIEVISLDQGAPCFKGFIPQPNDVSQKRFVRQ